MYFLLYTGTEEVEGSTALSNLGGYDMWMGGGGNEVLWLGRR
jgi:hypothetical protein